MRLYGWNSAMVRRGLLVVAFFAGSFGITLGVLHAIDSVKADFQNIGHMVAGNLAPKTFQVAPPAVITVNVNRVQKADRWSPYKFEYQYFPNCTALASAPCYMPNKA